MPYLNIELKNNKEIDYITNKEILYPVKTNIHTEKIKFDGTIYRENFGKERMFNSIEYGGFITASHKNINVIIRYFGGRKDWFNYYLNIYFESDKINLIVDNHTEYSKDDFKRWFPEVNEIPNWYNSHSDSEEILSKIWEAENMKIKDYKKPIPISFYLWLNPKGLKHFLINEELKIVDMVYDCIKENEKLL